MLFLILSLVFPNSFTSLSKILTQRFSVHELVKHSRMPSRNGEYA